MGVGMRTKIPKVHSLRGAIDGLNKGFRVGKIALKIGHQTSEALHAGGYGQAIPLHRFDHALDFADKAVKVAEPVLQHAEKYVPGVDAAIVPDAVDSKKLAKDLVDKAVAAKPMQEKNPSAITTKDIVGASARRGR